MLTLVIIQLSFSAVLRSEGLVTRRWVAVDTINDRSEIKDNVMCDGGRGVADFPPSDIFIGQEKLKYRWLQLEGHRHIEGQRPCLLFSESTIYQ